MPGPIPLRSDEKGPRHQNAENGMELKKGVARGVKKLPQADPKWAPRAKEWFNSLKSSGMVDFYEESDWATAKILCDALTGWYAKLPKDRSAMLLDIILKQMGNLGATEGERRRMRIELDLPEIPEETTGSKAMDMYRQTVARPASNVSSINDARKDS